MVPPTPQERANGNRRPFLQRGGTLRGTPGRGGVPVRRRRAPRIPAGSPSTGGPGPGEVGCHTHPALCRRRRPPPRGSGPFACSSCCQAPTSPGTPGSRLDRPAAPGTWLRRGGGGDGGGTRRSGRRWRGQRGAGLRATRAHLRDTPPPAAWVPLRPAPRVTLRGPRSQMSAAAAPPRTPTRARALVPGSLPLPAREGVKAAQERDVGGSWPRLVFIHSLDSLLLQVFTERRLVPGLLPG